MESTEIYVLRLRIKEVAKQKGVSIADLALKLRISRRTMYNWINGNITMHDLVSVSVYLRCSFYELIETPEGFSFIYDDTGNFKGLSK